MENFGDCHLCGKRASAACDRCGKSICQRHRRCEGLVTDFQYRCTTIDYCKPACKATVQVGYNTMESRKIGDRE